MTRWRPSTQRATKWSRSLLAATVLSVAGAAALPAIAAHSATSCTGQWQTQFFNNTSLSGSPAATRCDSAINFSWGTAAPAAGVSADSFSARWTQAFTFAAGSYTFSTTSDDGIRLLLDPGSTSARTVISNWTDHGVTTNTATVSVAAGVHTVVVEYYDHTGSATAKASWTPGTPSASSTPAPSTSPTPTASPTPTSSTCPAGQWQGQYFNNMTLSGPPAVTRCDTAINFNWGTSAPVSGVSADKFSVRWTQLVGFTGGSYTFSTTSDDGIRVFLDPGTSAARTVINDWSDHGSTTDTATVNVPAGNHTVAVEYYDNTGGAVAQASWTAASTSSPTPTPTSTSSAGVPTKASGWWWADQSNVPLGSMGCGSSSGTSTANALNQQWDYWDQCGGSEVSVSGEGLPNTPWGGDRVVKWTKPAGDSNVYQKLNRTMTKDNWPAGSAGPSVPNTGSPADVSGDYITYQYIPSAKFTLNPSHGWTVLDEFKENYHDSSGTWHQDPTWQLGCNNFSGSTMCSLSPHSTTSFPLSNIENRWVKIEFKLYQGAKDTTGHGGRIELWIDDKLIDTGYESQLHVGSAAFTSLSNTLAWIWISGQYTSNQTTNGVPDYQNTNVTSYVGLSTIRPLK